MESPKDQIVRLLEEGFDDGDVVEALRIALKKAKVSSGTESIEKEPSSKYGSEDLKIKSLKYYFNEIGLLSCDIAGALATYNKLGPFDYGLEAEEMVDIEKWNGENFGEEAIYFGQLKDGERNNFGIMVTAKGYIYEGFWRNDKQHGPGRIIYKDGTYLIGEYKNGSIHNGKSYFSDGYEEATIKDGGWS